MNALQEVITAMFMPPAPIQLVPLPVLVMKVSLEGGHTVKVTKGKILHVFDSACVLRNYRYCRGDLTICTNILLY